MEESTTRVFFGSLIKTTVKIFKDFAELKDIICCSSIPQQQEITTNINR